MTYEEARAKVAIGAAHLDRILPQWFDHIQVESFNISSQCSCVLGQLDGDFSRAIRKRNIIPRAFWQPESYAHDIACSMGFDVSRRGRPLKEMDRHDYKLLQDAWVDAMADRKCRCDAQTIGGGVGGVSVGDR